MSTTSKKTAPKNKAKKARCPRYAVPISKDRADAFVGPRADLLPRATERPSRRAERAFDLQAKGLNQRQIARELRCSQSTVHRDIDQYRRWFGTTLPEDRGELTGFAWFRVAVEEHRIFLEHQRRLAMEEWERSRQSVPVKKTRTKTYPQGRKHDGDPVQEVVVEETVKAQAARVSHFNAAKKLSLELTMLEAGYLGVRGLACDQAIDIDERDRWDRAVKSRDATIGQLEKRVKELEGRLGPGSGVFGTSDSPSVQIPQPKTPDPLARQSETRADQLAAEIRADQKAHTEQDRQPRGTGVFGGCVLPLAESLAPKTPDPEGPDRSHESKPVENSPVLKQIPSPAQVATPLQPALCDQPLDSSAAISQAPESIDQDPESTPHTPREDGISRSEMSTILELGLGAGIAPPSAKLNDGLPLCNMGDLSASILAGSEIPEEKEKRPRWDDAARQEALDYYCRIHGIPPLELHQVTGLPDPKHISPKMAIERGYPYILHCDRSIPSKRPQVRIGIRGMSSRCGEW